MRPEVDVSQDLGLSFLRWRNIYVSGINGVSTSQIIDTQTSLNGLSGTLTLTSPDASILIGDGPQAIELSGLFTAASGALVQQHSADLLTLSGLVLADTGQTSVNGLSGLVSISGVNLEVTTSGQTILVSGIMNAASGAILEQKCDDIITLSGLILPDGGQTSINGFSGVLNFEAGNNGLVITDPVADPQVFTFTPLFTYASGQIIDDKCLDLTIVSGITDSLLRSGTTLNGLSGAITLTSPDNSIFIGDNGQSIELSGIFTAASGAVLQQKCEDITTVSGTVVGLPEKAVMDFTDASGVSFVMYHGLNTENFTWNMWEKDDAGTSIQNYVFPKTLRPSGVDHVEVGLASVMVGTLIIVG
tara:strand:+ start:827 stop:1906 length:1080 start_codon:yes stop_codon:yes gene_type:complete